MIFSLFAPYLLIFVNTCLISSLCEISSNSCRKKKCHFFFWASLSLGTYFYESPDNITIVCWYVCMNIYFTKAVSCSILYSQSLNIVCNINKCMMNGWINTWTNECINEWNCMRLLFPMIKREQLTKRLEKNFYS